MADVTDPQLVKWANERNRTIADLAVKLKYAVDAWKADYVSDGIATRLAEFTGTDVIDDGSATDGRAQVTVSDMLILANALDVVQAGLESVAVAGTGSQFAFAFLNKWQVNGSPR